MDNRFRKINTILSDYSLGNFNKKLRISSRMDEVDAFIMGINMLGEELKDKTISRNYFNNIFNSVSDMVFVLDKQRRIENINTSVSSHLGYSLRSLKGKPISYLLDRSQPDWVSRVFREMRASRMTSHETVFKTKTKKKYSCTDIRFLPYW